MGTVHGRRTAGGPTGIWSPIFSCAFPSRSEQPTQLGDCGECKCGPNPNIKSPQVLAGGPHNLHHIPRCTRPHRPAIDSFNDGPPSTGRDHIFLVDDPTLINAPTMSVASTSETETH
ncbi:hypothetical protein ACE6H2_017130 [Prunus campanulata]